MASLLYKWLLLSFISFSSPHPFYISVTEINHNEKDKTLEISCKLFAEDLEKTIEKNNNKELDITADKDKAAFDQYIPAYINQHLSIRTDGKALPMQYVGFEKDKEYLYCYFEIDGVSAPHKFEISDNILQDFTKEQLNIIHVIVDGKRQSTRLNYPDHQASFSF
jgi:hypothetical protein